MDKKRDQGESRKERKKEHDKERDQEEPRKKQKNEYDKKKTGGINKRTV